MPETETRTRPSTKRPAPQPTPMPTVSREEVEEIVSRRIARQDRPINIQLALPDNYGRPGRDEAGQNRSEDWESANKCASPEVAARETAEQLTDWIIGILQDTIGVAMDAQEVLFGPAGHPVTDPKDKPRSLIDKLQHARNLAAVTLDTVMRTRNQL